ncbi:MAG: putative 7-carboxy-7-deazaguanine synthase QueE [Clostridiales bacterium]|nr:putative 7-carboxy-7-deazaguanine synthase QueE [Clostridiales bacterium]
MASYRVVEIFKSINGEGLRQGQLALFIRMQGCNLHCSYCDTRWANTEDARFHWMSTEEIIDLVEQMQIRNITLTGGEPLCQENIGELLLALAAEPRIRVEIETNGSVSLKPFAQMQNAPSFNMDYKLPGSGMENHMNAENFSVLTAKDTVKFVVGNYEDLCRARDLIREYGLTERCHVFLSPVYEGIELEDVVNFMKDNEMNDVTMQLQIHKIIWDSEMRGV